MERPLRLGDLVDDYCPRERRLTNHAVVALVGEAIKQTRCTTCDAEHVFKGGKLPARRSKAGADKGQPVDNSGGQMVMPRSAAPAEGIESAEIPAGLSAAAEGPASQPAVAAQPQIESPQVQEETNENRPAETHVWAANRTLIRAQLPRVEGEVPPPRPIPEFTMHRYNARGGGNFRHGRGGGGGGGWDRGNGFGNGSRRQGNPNANGNVNGNSNANGNTFGGGQGQGHGGRRRHKKRPR